MNGDTVLTDITDPPDRSQKSIGRLWEQQQQGGRQKEADVDAQTQQQRRATKGAEEESPAESSTIPSSWSKLVSNLM